MAVRHYTPAANYASAAPSQPRYAHLCEPDVHPYQALCGWEWDGSQTGPQPPICPTCLALYEAIDGPKGIERG